MNPGLDDFALGCARPWAAWGLGLPFLFLALVRAVARAPRIVIATLFLWRELGSSAERGRTERGRIPAWAFWCALGLLAGALAGLGPRRPRPLERTWTCVVDRSPSMGLPLGSATRLDAALERCARGLRAAARGRDRVRWLSPGRASLRLAPSERPPAAWLALEPGLSAPEWALHDEPGTVWVTDRDPPEPRARAGLAASGGPAVPGAIALEGGSLVLWDGSELRTAPSPRAPMVLLRGDALPAPLGRVLAAWCAGRGLELARAPSDGSGSTVLVLEQRAAEEARAELPLGRDGWSASGRGALPAGGGRADGEDWLTAEGADGQPIVLVRARAGRIEVGLAELGEPRGDGTAFVLSWARLFDRWALPPEGVVALAERVAAGEGVFDPGEPPPASDSSADLGPRVDAALALAAALCAAVALVLGLRA
jgi:hypothetical protein